MLIVLYLYLIIKEILILGRLEGGVATFVEFTFVEHLYLSQVVIKLILLSLILKSLDGLGASCRSHQTLESELLHLISKLLGFRNLVEVLLGL